MNMLPSRGPISSEDWGVIMKKCGYQQDEIKDIPRCDQVIRKHDLLPNEKRLVQMMETDDMEFFEMLHTNPEFIQRMKNIERVAFHVVSGHYGYVFIPAHGKRQGNMILVRLKS